MAYDTKLIIRLIADNIAKSESLREAYDSVVEAANIEGVKLPNYKEAREEIERKRADNRAEKK
jgi:hypothetical protein